MHAMHRRAFFRLGAIGLAPLVACTGRDELGPSQGGGLAEEFEKLRSFKLPEGIAPSLDFRPLRQKP